MRIYISDHIDMMKLPGFGHLLQLPLVYSHLFHQIVLACKQIRWSCLDTAIHWAYFCLWLH